jgi:hypothetical protein
MSRMMAYQALEGILKLEKVATRKVRATFFYSVIPCSLLG